MHEADMRTLLFVPASRPERFAKALDSGADAVIIDLEDAVAEQDKEAARDNVCRFAASRPQARFLVRTNEAASTWFEADVALCRDVANVAGTLLPKAESAAQVAAVAAAGKPVLPLIESAMGLHELDAIAGARGVDRLSFGALDLMLDLGVTPDTDGARLLLDDVRCQLLVHSRVQHLAAPIDSIHADFNDAQGLAAAAGLARDLGFGGMLCIHPRQIEVVHQAFAPSEEQLARARRIVAEAEATGASAFKLDGEMVDRPVIERARRVIARAGG